MINPIIDELKKREGYRIPVVSELDFQIGDIPKIRSGIQTMLCAGCENEVYIFVSSVGKRLDGTPQVHGLMGGVDGLKYEDGTFVLEDGWQHPYRELRLNDLETAKVLGLWDRRQR